MGVDGRRIRSAFSAFSRLPANALESTAPRNAIPLFLSAAPASVLSARYRQLPTTDVNGVETPVGTTVCAFLDDKTVDRTADSDVDGTVGFPRRGIAVYRLHERLISQRAPWRHFRGLPRAAVQCREGRREAAMRTKSTLSGSLSRLFLPFSFFLLVSSSLPPSRAESPDGKHQTRRAAMDSDSWMWSDHVASLVVVTRGSGSGNSEPRGFERGGDASELDLAC